ncbi:MAG: hypothetical protein IKZ00_00935 [Bacteroidaceae bacterium]|nr:hypothetical protein [Bacteroidaceae bacterium]
MTIILKTPLENGGYSSPQSWSAANIPTSHAVIPGSVDMTDFYEYNGFVVLTIEQVEGVDTVTGYTPNVEAWEAWKAEQPEPEPEPPTMEERIAALEEENAAMHEQLAQADDAAIELYEMQMAQEAINAAQDDALIEIYEMIGG